MDTPYSRKKVGVSIFFLLFLLQGCSANSSPQSPFISPKLDNPPTDQSLTSLPPVFPTQTTQPYPTNTAINCTDNLLYLDDLTVPDWTNIKPETEIDKQWQVENNGTCNWDFRYRLRLISGDRLGVETERSLFPARAGTKAVIQITFTSPLTEGTYQSVWQAYNPSNQPFGDPISILIVVTP